MYIPSGLIEEQDLWCGNELAGNRKSSLLPTRYALPDGRADDGLSLILQSERRKKLVNASSSFVAWDRA